MPSPKPRPAALKLVEGRNGRDSGGRPVKPPPGFVRVPPEAPEWLPDEARAEWERVVPELARLELTKPVDRAALTAYVLCWQRLVDARKIASEHQIVATEIIRDADGNVTDTITTNMYGLIGRNSQGLVRAPWIAVEEAASKELRAWCAEFGFTPSAEARVSSGGDDGGEENPYG